MNEEEQIIKIFYACFQKLDWRGMLACYREDVVFYDPVFENLDGKEVRAMWEMLLKNAKDLDLGCSNIRSSGDGYGSCDWIATYTFSQTGRKVINKGKAHFKFQDGKIAEHQDVFDWWMWSRRRMARRNLEKFMAAKTS